VLYLWLPSCFRDRDFIVGNFLRGLSGRVRCLIHATSLIHVLFAHPAGRCFFLRMSGRFTTPMTHTLLDSRRVASPADARFRSDNAAGNGDFRVTNRVGRTQAPVNLQRQGPSSRSGERTPTQNFLEVLTEASALQRIEMALKPQNDRQMKSLEGSIPLSRPSSLPRTRPGWLLRGQASNRQNDNTDRSRACW